MANPYTTQTISGYNSSPPEDDGSQVSTNEIKWSTHKTKLGDPVKTLAEAINTETLAAFGLTFGQTISTHSSPYTVVAADRGKFLSVTGTTTITLIAVATAGDGFPLAIINTGTATVTVDGSGAETINGSATVTLNPGNSIILTTQGTAWIGAIGLGDSSIKTAGVASAVNEITVTNAATGNAVDIAATGTDTNIDLQLTAKGTGRVVNSAAVSGYVSGITEYIEAESAGNSTTLDIDANIGSTFESVGPTGSGATNIWPPLNDVPAGSTYIIVAIYHYAYAGSGLSFAGDYTNEIHCRKGGSSKAIGDSTIKSKLVITKNVNDYQIGDLSEVRVPISSTVTFDMAFVSSIVSSTTAYMYLVGWGI